MGLALQPAPAFTAQSFLNNLNGQGANCTEIDRWNNSGWESYHLTLGGTNFTVQPGQGYFVNCTTLANWQLTGAPITTGLPLTLQPGWNLLAVPHSASSYQAQSLLLAIAAQGGSCNEIDHWRNSGWESYHLTLGGTTFSIVADEGYFVQCSTASTFTP